MALLQSVPLQNDSPIKKHRLRFKGDSGEYFRLSIVNFALTVLTLGLYSPWAKVRARRYLYGNTYLAGSNFQYHANPIGILKGRLILFAVVALGLGAHFLLHVPKWQWALLTAATLPALIVKGSIFNARNTSYRGIRFDFESDYNGAYKLYGLLTVVVFYTGGFTALVAPAVQANFKLKNFKFGTQKFIVSNKWGDVVGSYLLAGLLSALSVVCLLVLLIFGFKFLHGHAKLNLQLITMAALAVLPFQALFSAAYVRARSDNLIAAKVEVGPIKFGSDLRFRDLFKLYALNGLAIVGSLGLAIPWARILTLRYRAEHTYILARSEELNNFTQANLKLVHPDQGAGFSDLSDFDFGL